MPDGVIVEGPLDFAAKAVSQLTDPFQNLPNKSSNTSDKASGVAADYINNKKIDISINQNDISTYYTNLAFKNYDFKLWNLVGEYSKYNKTN